MHTFFPWHFLNIRRYTSAVPFPHMIGIMDIINPRIWRMQDLQIGLIESVRQVFCIIQNIHNRNIRSYWIRIKINPAVRNLQIPADIRCCAATCEYLWYGFASITYNNRCRNPSGKITTVTGWSPWRSSVWERQNCAGSMFFDIFDNFFFFHMFPPKLWFEHYSIIFFTPFFCIFMSCR